MAVDDGARPTAERIPKDANGFLRAQQIQNGDRFQRKIATRVRQGHRWNDGGTLAVHVDNIIYV